jgi:uncharacterized membrane protein
MSSSSPDGIKVRTLRALSGRGGPQHRLKIGAGVILIGVILLLVSGFWLGLLIVALGVIVTGVIKGKRS